MKKTERTLVSALKRRKRSATVADLISETALPANEVKEALTSMLDEYRGQLQVTESGELLYYFPHGFRSAYRGFGPRLRRFVRKTAAVAAKAAKVLFKVWIMVMLIGYFVLFVALLVAAIFASIAASAAGRGESRSRSRMGGFGAFYLTTRIFQMFVYLWMYSSVGKKPKKRGRPLHQSVFAFVFGEENPNKTWDQNMRKVLIRYIQSRRGVVSTEEAAAITGLSMHDSQNLLHRMLREYEGEPGVTEEGSLYYQFPKLMMTGEQREHTAEVSVPKKSLIPFNTNTKKMNGWIAFFNGFNLLFGTYFLTFSFQNVPPSSQAQGIESFYAIVHSLLSSLGDPSGFMYIGLGIVPVAFSIVYFGTTWIRRTKEKRLNKEIRRHNFRKRLLNEVTGRPLQVNPERIEPKGNDEVVSNVEGVREEEIKNIGVFTELEVSEDEDGKFVYSFPELERKRRDLAQFRESIDPSRYDIGGIVFDSGE